MNKEEPTTLCMDCPITSCDWLIDHKKYKGMIIKQGTIGTIVTYCPKYMSEIKYNKVVTVEMIAKILQISVRTFYRLDYPSNIVIKLCARKGFNIYYDEESNRYYRCKPNSVNK